MITDLATTNFLIGLGTVGLQLFGIFLLVVLWGRAKSPALQEVSELVKAWALPLTLAITFLGSATSLYYSEILGLAPCGLCWLQRVALYPQVVITALAWKIRDTHIAIYAFTLSAIGAVIALYHHAIQMGFQSPLPCPAVASAANCSQRFFFEFGYLTFPLVSFTGFAVVMLLMLFLWERKRS